MLCLLAAAAAGCGDSFRDCSEEDASLAETLPTSLSQTGLYDDIVAKTVAAAAIEFQPRFPLWTDGAKKRRWLLLPDGATVDTRDLDAFDFPVGTKTFKEFALDGLRLETRMNLRTEDGWTGVSYVWDEAEGEALRQLDPVPDVAGTDHDIPGAQQCLTCHGGRGNFTLGFSATQLDGNARTALWERGVLSDPIEATIELEPAVEAGLGVLHGNCSHCHNETRALQPQATVCYAPGEGDAFDLSLPADLKSLDDAPVMATARWALGRPGDSEIVDRMSRRNQRENNPSMPPLGTEIVDDDGIRTVEALIAELPAQNGDGGR
jgi:mono/diheme cytochrome c family protein